ncbi:MAG: hypothetical protein KAG66_19310, partial [Methylococcales bacterium]|nr:hypothetical protein [Methylococcales bacterium]
GGNAGIFPLRRQPLGKYKIKGKLFMVSEVTNVYYPHHCIMIYGHGVPHNKSGYSFVSHMSCKQQQQ